MISEVGIFGMLQAITNIPDTSIVKFKLAFI